jgi:3-hydroxyisobutyrate dehydrogenase-like beta-hydroxyacid dehydrogenase
MSARWALLGFGEVGEILVGPDVLGPLEPAVVLPGMRAVSAATRARLDRAGIEPLTDPAALGSFDVVLSVVTPASAADVAHDAAPHLQPGALYVDANSISGETARQIAEIVADDSAAFVDAVFMGAVPLLRAAVPMYLSGPGASAFASLASDAGLVPRLVSERPGDASDLKMLWSVMSKGTIGLVAETLTAAERLGLTASVLELLAEQFGRTGSADMVLRMLESTARSGPRRLDEMAAARETLARAGVPATMVDAASAWIELLSERGSAAGAPDVETAIAAASADVAASSPLEQVAD